MEELYIGSYEEEWNCAQLYEACAEYDQEYYGEEYDAENISGEA